MIRRLLAALAIVILAMLIAAQIPGGLEVVLTLLFGWFGFLARISSKITPNPTRIVSTMLLCGLIIVGLQWFLAWFSRHAVSESPRRWRLRWTAAVMAVFCLMFVTGLAFIGVVHQVAWLMTSPQPHLLRYPAVMPKPDGMKMTALGIHNAATANDGAFPLATVRSSRGEPVHGWQTTILPYMPYRNDTVDWELPWSSPRNAPFFRLLIPDYLSPDVPVVRDSAGFGLSHYAGNARILRDQQQLVWKDPLEGTSQVVLLGEIGQAFPAWGKPGNVRDLTLGLNRSPLGFGNVKGDGAEVYLLDGSVRFVRNGVDPAVLRAMSGVSLSTSTVSH